MNTGPKNAQRRGCGGLGRILLVALGLMCASAQAADREWTGALNNYWGNANNWDPTGPGPSDTAVFTDAGANHNITLLGGVTTINALLFDSTSTYIIADGSLSISDLTANAGVVTHDLLVDVDVAQGSTWTINSDATVVVSGQFTADGGLQDNGVVKAGSGTLMLAGDNDNVPTDMTITDGVVRLIGGAAYSNSEILWMTGSSGTLRLDDDETIGGLHSSSMPAVDLAGNSLTFNVLNPTLVTFAGSITGDATSMLRKTGAGRQTLTGSTEVGGFLGLNGTFRIIGGTFTMPDDGVQTFTVLGANSLVEVRNGGMIQLPSTSSGGVQEGRCNIGDGAEMLITGAGSSIVASRVDASGTSAGTLTVATGGLLDVTLGSDPWIFVAANTNGSAQGELTVENGGAVVTDSVMVGLAANNIGTITVQHQGSTLNTMKMFLGGYNADQFGGAGSLTITDGGSVSLQDRLDVLTSTSSISVEGGVLNTPSINIIGDISPLVEISDPPGGTALVLGGVGLGSASTINYAISNAAGGPGSIEKNGMGRLTLAHGCTYSGGLTVFEGHLRLQDAARQFASLTGSGPVVFQGIWLDGTGVIAGGLSVAGSGLLRPSDESGAGIGLIECGSLNLGPNTALEVQLGGMNSFDQVHVEGTAAVGGTLKLSYTNGFTASPGDWFEIINAGDVTGEFFSIQWPDSQNWTAYEAGGSLWVGICDGSSACLADCIDETQVYGPRTPAESVIGDGSIVVLNRGSAGVEIVDASNPTLGPSLATIPASVSIPTNSKGMALSGSLLAVTGVDGGYPLLLDVSDPSNPVWLAGLINLDAYDVAIRGDLLAVAHSFGLALLDISDPANYVFLVDIDVPLPFGESGTVTFHDGLLYWSWQSDDFFTGEVVILNVDDPSNPVEVGAIAANFFVSEPQFKDDIMLLSNDAGVRAIDISDVTNPTQVASIALPGIDQESALLGGLFYRVSSVGLTVLDVTNPAAPVKIDHLVGFAGDDGVTSIAGKLHVVGASGLSVVEAGDGDGDGVTDLCDICVGNDASGDTDGDGFCNDIDSCPESSAPDSDGDGVCDDEDGCPNDPNKVEPGECGCGVDDTDSDSDGTADCNDNCPTDPNKTEPGTCGCGTSDVDSDSDGTPDCIDNCPNDPSKINPGQCGCGIPDNDADSDGTANCNDGCPNDPYKTTPGICGCGVSDDDSDGDGTADCNDGCPTDPEKTVPGVCGCGTPDADDDNDGVPNCVDQCEGAPDVDTDNDGTLDCEDACPTDPDKIDPGTCGCNVPDTDSDNDGTADCIDMCPNDPNKTQPGQCGCGNVDTDSDSDGTADCNDGCPNDPNKTMPGVCGCGAADVDSDNDGVEDCNDDCPNDPNKTEPGVCGCGAPDTDTDGDGTPDCIDGCPEDPSKTEPGICGCGVADDDDDGDGIANCLDQCDGAPDVDSDNDGTLDCNDGCPNDPDKVEPGQCGCGNVDTDTDSDGTADCNDGCPDDPGKVEPGICGCGVEDIDSDSDGTFDCNDGCPNDPNKIKPGACGCGVADTDSDGDMVPFCLDCDDTNADVYPGNIETTCDELDNDCDPLTEDNPSGICEVGTPITSAEGPRYLEVIPVGGDVAVALQVTSDDFECLSMYINFDGNPDLAALGIAALVDAPVYRTAAEWGTLHVRGLEIVPDTSYTVHTLVQGQGTVASSAAQQTLAHGDVDDNGVANFADIQSVVFGFQNVWTGPLGAVDLAPCLPNAIVNFEDIQQAVFAFQNQAFEVICDLPCSGGVASAAATTMDDPSSVTLYLSVDQSAAGNHGQVLVEAWVSGAVDLHTYQLTLDAVDGEGNVRRPVDAWIDEDAAGFAFAGREILSAANLQRGTIGAASLDGPVTIGDVESRKLATFVFDTSVAGKLVIRLADNKDNLLLDAWGRSMPVMIDGDTVVRTSEVATNKRGSPGIATSLRSQR